MYTVERKPDVFETVKADYFEIIEGGWVAFWEQVDAISRKLVIAFAPGQVITFFKEDE
jgi:hypothetical protein